MEYVSPHYEYTLDLLAGRLVTPERFGGHLATVHTLLVENIRGLYEPDPAA
jgi:hypothetical protein